MALNPATQGTSRSTSGSIKRPNRRITARIACRLSVSYAATPGEWRPATAMDLSRLGCRLRTGEDLPREKKVSVRVEFRMADEPVLSVDGIGTVMWTRLEGLSYQTGIQFDTEPEGLSDLLGIAR
jgi:PilZ domain